MNLRKAIGIICLLLLFIPGVGFVAKKHDLCIGIDMKPILSIEQVRQNELVDFLMELADLKQPKYGWPEDISGYTPEELYKLEVKILVEYGGFPPMFQDIEPERVVNRRYFAEVMFEVAMQKDPKFKEDCGGAATDTEKLRCLDEHNYVFDEAGKIYRNEILAVLCNKTKEWAPPPEVVGVEVEFVVPEEIVEINIEYPASPAS